MREFLLYVLTYKMSIDTMSIHNTEHPTFLHICEITDNKVAILIRFTHLRNVTCASLSRNFFDYISFLILITVSMLLLYFYTVANFIEVERSNSVLKNLLV